MIDWLKNNHLVLVATIGLLVGIALIVKVIEGQLYAAEKSELIIEELMSKQISMLRREEITKYAEWQFKHPHLHLKDLKWSEFCTQLMDAGASETLSCGKRIWDLLPDQVRGNIESNATSRSFTIPISQDIVIEGLNEIIERRDFFQPEYFANVRWPQSLSELLQRDPDSLTEREIQWRNRWLIEAAFPNSFAKSNQVKQNLINEIAELILDETNVIFRISLEDVTGAETLDVDEHVLLQALSGDRLVKTRDFNTFKNCLFFRRFAKSAKSAIYDATEYERGNPDPRIVGRILWHYTTPPDNEPIERLTLKYYWILLGVLLTLIAFYLYLMWFLFLPIKRVVGRIGESKSRLPRILPSPHMLLEKSYNQLARNALLTALNQQLSSLLPRSGSLSKAGMLQGLPELICDNLMLPRAAFFEITFNAGGELDFFQQFTPSVEQLDFAQESGLTKQRRAEVAGIILQQARKRHALGPTWIISSANDQAPVIVSLLDMAPDHRRAELFLCQPPRKVSRDALLWLRESLALAMKQIHTGLETLELQKNMIVWEKRQASINLSRNLGHDLTNIIATSKFDLMTLKTLTKELANKPDELTHSQQLMSESLEHLSNNTRFLQEIVNIYRAFSYIKHPRYESIQINRLLQEICKLFRLSTSARITLTTRFDERLQTCTIESRLIKLAVFNLLNNAAEAIKRKPAAKDKEWIRLSTRQRKKKSALEITISDSGTGICDNSGKPLSPHEIEGIFELGVSAKKVEEAGEGFGLNWVKTIVVDFHNGRLSARNLEKGGAAFTILLPIKLHPSEIAALKPNAPLAKQQKAGS